MDNTLEMTRDRQNLLAEIMKRYELNLYCLIYPTNIDHGFLVDAIELKEDLPLFNLVSGDYITIGRDEENIFFFTKENFEKQFRRTGL